MTLDTTLNLDGFGEGSPVSTGGMPAGWSVLGVAPVAGAAAAVHGARGARWSTTAVPGRMQYDFGANVTGRLIVASGYFLIDTMPTANLYLGGILTLPSGGTTQGDWRVNPDRSVSIRNLVSGALIAADDSGTTLLATDAVYRSKWTIDQTANTQQLDIYVGESATPVITLTGAWSSNTCRVVAAGTITGAPGGVLNMDTIRIGDADIAPFAPPVAATVWKRFDGTVWVDSNMVIL